MRSWGLAFLIATSGCSATPTEPREIEQPNLAPLITSIPTTSDHDLVFEAMLSASDPDGDPVSISVGTKPAWLHFDSATATVRGTPGEPAIGPNQLTIIASDGRLTSRTTATINVRVGTTSLVGGGAWIAHTPFAFKHDGSPLSSDRFVVYNDFSGPGIKEALAEKLEATLDTLGSRLGVISDDEYDFPPGGRQHVYADKLQGDASLGYRTTVNGWAFQDGLILMAPDAPRYARQGYTAERYHGLVTHELMHAVEFMLIGRAVPLLSTDAWFREGIATYMAGLAPGGAPIESVTRATLAQWRATHAAIQGGGNPIGIRAFSFPPGVTNPASYYMWFAQAVRYMVDDAGFGIGEEGLRGIYADVRAGMLFADSFEERAGISLQAFEDEFWTRMEAFLPAG